MQLVAEQIRSEACGDVGVEVAGLDECLRSWIGKETGEEVEEEADDK